MKIDHNGPDISPSEFMKLPIQEQVTFMKEREGEDGRVLLTLLQKESDEQLRLSTVLLSFPLSDCWYETMLFDDKGQSTDCWRYKTKQEAIKGHTVIVNTLLERGYTHEDIHSQN